MTNTELCRKNLLDRLNIFEKDKRSSSEVWSEISGAVSALEFIVALAKPRLIMGGIRYSSRWQHKDLMAYMEYKLSQYRKTGNFEMLIDLVNFCGLEGALKTHPNHHFTGEDR